MIDGMACHGIHKSGVWRVKEFTSQFYFLFPKKSEHINYIEYTNDMSDPVRAGPNDFKGVKFHDLADMPNIIEISITNEEKLFLGNIYKKEEKEVVHRVEMFYEGKT